MAYALIGLTGDHFDCRGTRGHLKRGQAKGWGETWEEIEAKVAADIPTRRITRRSEVAALVAFLCSAQSNAIHGQNIRIDGGQWIFCHDCALPQDSRGSC